MLDLVNQSTGHSFGLGCGRKISNERMLRKVLGSNSVSRIPIRFATASATR